MAVAMALMAAPAQALVQHAESEWAPGINLGPAPAVVGRWSWNASAVAIGPNDAPAGYLTDYVITVRHQGGGIGSGVNFGGVDYSVYDEFVNPTADLRMVRIRDSGGHPAALADWAGAYTGTDETTRQNRTAVIGGFGKSRGATYSNYYTWAGSDNLTQRWGQNKVEGYIGGLPASSLLGASYKSDVLAAYFDASSAGSYVPYESAIAEFDSGGGWFLPVGSQWKLAGLSAYVQTSGEKSYFSGVNPPPHAGEGMYPIRISSYANWIEAVFKRSAWQSTTGGWADAANWSAGVPSGVDKFAVLLNSLSDSRTVTVSAGTPFGTIRFDSRGNYTIDSAGVGGLECLATIGAGAIEVYDGNGAGSHTITAPIKLSSPLVINQTSAGALLTLAGSLTTPGGLPAPTGLTKVGSGTLVLSGSNTFNGGLEIQKGTVRVTSAGALGTPSTDPKWGIVGVTLKAAGLDFRTDTDLTFAHSVKVVPLTASTLTSTFNVDRLTAGTGRTVTLGSLTADGAVTLNVTGGNGCRLAFSGLASFTNTGSGATINTAGADLALTGGLSLTGGTLTKSGPGALTVAGSQTAATSPTTFRVNGGTLALNADAGSASVYNLAVNVAGGAATFGSTQHLAGLTLTGGSGALASGPDKVLVTKSLSVDPAASRLDIADNHMIVDYTGTSPLPQVTQWVRSGYGGGTWLGNGITSSTAASSGCGMLGVGVIDNADPVVGGQKQFAGEKNFDSSSLLLAYTYLGDANLDGVIDANDYNPIDGFFALYWDGNERNMVAVLPDGPCYQKGDFNYDGVIDANDYNLIDAAYVFQWGPLSGGVGPLEGVLPTAAGPAGAGSSGGLATVPEPGAAALVVSGLAALAARRRTRR